MLFRKRSHISYCEATGFHGKSKRRGVLGIQKGVSLGILRFGSLTIDLICLVCVNLSRNAIDKSGVCRVVYVFREIRSQVRFPVFVEITRRLWQVVANSFFVELSYDAQLSFRNALRGRL
jgi:hypothetical protein